jgi:CheY-like chemotaxis protein/HPt (histidine-containing phosphotransfer) domain-containing protein
MLSRMGCRVHLASSAMEGLRKLAEAVYDVVLMDIQMPGMDGVEALQLFRNPKQGRFTFVTAPQVPVVAVTANALEGDEQRFLNLGFDAYLSKPFRMAQLLRVLQSFKPQTDSGAAPLNDTPTAGPASTHATEVSNVPAIEPPAPVAVAAVTSSTPGAPKSALWREVFDDVAVQRLVELDPSGRNHLLERVTKMFASSVEKYLAQIDDAMRANDLKNVRDVAHTLKSSSANLGALKLSQCCVDIETVIRDQTGADLGSLILQLRTEAEKVLAALPLLLEAGQ